MIWRGLSYICDVLLTLTRTRNACRAQKQQTLREKPVAFPFYRRARVSPTDVGVVYFFDVSAELAEKRATVKFGAKAAVSRLRTPPPASDSLCRHPESRTGSPGYPWWSDILVQRHYGSNNACDVARSICFGFRPGKNACSARKEPAVQSKAPARTRRQCA